MEVAQVEERKVKRFIIHKTIYVLATKIDESLKFKVIGEDIYGNKIEEVVGNNQPTKQFYSKLSEVDFINGVEL